MADFLANLVAVLEMLMMVYTRTVEMDLFLTYIGTMAKNELWFWPGQEDIGDNPVKRMLRGMTEPDKKLDNARGGGGAVSDLVRWNNMQGHMFAIHATTS